MTSPNLAKEFQTGTLLKTTQSLCPNCLQSIEAEVYTRDNQVWMDKTCPDCGPYSAILANDAKSYLLAPKATGSCGCSSGGCGSAIDNHSCTLMIEITQQCNLTCPTCYAASSPNNHDFLSFDDYAALLDKLLIANHGDADVLQISGGEPTLHPRLFDMIDLAHSKGFKQVYLNTNGIKLSSERYAEQLSKLSKPPQIYLQFDGIKTSTYIELRGKDNLYQVKSKALANCERFGLETIPIMTLTRGINDDEIADFLQIAQTSKAVNKVMIQPAMYSGRYVNPRRLDRLTLSETIKQISDQSEVFSEEDFCPIPCGDPNCFRMALAIRGEDRLIPISRYFPPYEEWQKSETAAKLDSVTDTFDSSEALAEVMSWALQSEALKSLSEDEVDDLLGAVANVSSKKGQDGWQGLFAIGIKPFMDAYTYDQDRIDGCCTHIASRDGTPISFCQYNAINRPQGKL